MVTRTAASLGRPGWSLFPPSWEQHHEPVAAQQCTGHVRIWSGPVTRRTDPATGASIRDYGSLITSAPIPARLQQLSRANVETSGGQALSLHEYRVTVGRGVNNVTATAVVEVVASSDDSLTGRHLQVTDIQRGTLRWQRDLLATDNLE